jgi:ABC-type Fe3+ transport system substrate-binding protein
MRTTRREVLKALAGLVGVAAVGCSTTGAPASPTAAPAVTAAAATSGWDALVAAAKSEGKVVVSGPPDPGASSKLPDAFKQRFGIEVEYLAGNSSQLAARIQGERAAGQYTMDVSLSGSDTVYGTFLPNGWLEPLKPNLILPEVTDPTKWRTGEPWFRDPEKRMVMQIFNTAANFLTINTQMVSPEEIPDGNALLDPKWQGKIGAYDPGVNGAGIAVASAIYVTRGKEYATQLYQGQKVALSRDYAQVADWVAHGSYPITIGPPHQFLVQYYDAGLPLKEINVPDVPRTTAGGFGLVNLWTNAPHPNAAKVFVNWIASREGSTVYGQIENGVPVRSDIEPSWVPDDQVPKAGVTYFDTYDYDYVTTKRLEARDFYASLLH